MRTDHDNGALMRRSTNNSSSNAESTFPALFDPFNATDSLLSPSSFFTASPFQLMRRMQEDMDRLFGQVLGSGFGSNSSGALSAGGPASAAAGQQQQRLSPFFTPHMDVSETDKEYHLEVDLPGVPEDAIDIEVKGDNTLIIRAEVRQESSEGNDPQQPQDEQQEAKPQQKQQRQYHYRERRYGRFERVLSLPQNVNPQNIAANFQNGVLTVTLPKREQIAPQGRRIPIGGMAAATQEPQKPTMMSEASEPEQAGSEEQNGSRSADNMATASNAEPSSHRKNGKKLAHAAGSSSGS